MHRQPAVAGTSAASSNVALLQAGLVGARCPNRCRPRNGGGTLQRYNHPIKVGCHRDQVMAMSERTLVRLAWTTWATAIALVAAGVGMQLTLRYRFPTLASGSYSGETTIIPSVYATLGLVIATRRPRHPVGWLLIGCGLTASIQGTVDQYASLAKAADLPGRVHGLWAFSLAQRAWFGQMVLLFLLFPTGRLPSPRWRPVAWALVTGLGLIMLTQALTPGTLADFPEEQNPFGAPALAPVLEPLGAVGGPLLVGGALGAIAALIVRLRRSRGRERQQIKWFVYVALLGIAVIFVLGPLLTGVIGGLPHGYGGVVGVLLNPWLLTPIALAVTVAAAIVRHRLYDIDRVINPGLWAAHGAAGVGVRGRGVRAWPAARSGRRPVRAGRGRLHSGRRRPVPAGPATGADRRGPSVQPGPL
jgi:hypothetical protein